MEKLLTLPFPPVPGMARRMCYFAWPSDSIDCPGHYGRSFRGCVPGADIELTNLETNAKRQVKSGESGDFEVPDLQRGTYRMTVTHSGSLSSADESISRSKRPAQPAPETFDRDRANE